MSTNICKRKRGEEVIKNDMFMVGSLKKLKEDFNENPTNKLIQNSLCGNYLHSIAEVREYMQSRDRHFSHTLEPKLVVTNQGMSGRCWMFAVLNVLRHELIRDLNLPHNFEFSESYLAFYEKIEKCNHFLTKFITKDKIDSHDLKVRDALCVALDEGGLWVSCANLIKKYGLVPKTCYLESINSFCTDVIDDILSLKLREFALVLVNTKHSEREEFKSKMMIEVYQILSKMLGTPPCPDEEFTWSFLPNRDLVELIENEQSRIESGKYETLKIKQVLTITPIDFYKKFISHSLDDYLNIINDPRNEYYKYYQSSESDIVVGFPVNGFYNMPIDKMAELCILSILDNTPVQFSCDVHHYFHPRDRLFDTKCFDYDLLFGKNFDKLTKEELLNVYGSYANHAMVFVGVDLDESGKPLKWKVENSWGRSNDDDIDENDDGYYVMSHEWFKKYVYDVVIHKKYSSRQLYVDYKKQKKSPITLPENDIMGSRI